MTQSLMICSGPELSHHHQLSGLRGSREDTWLEELCVTYGGERGGKGQEKNHVLTGNVEIPISRPKDADFHRAYRAQR